MVTNWHFGKENLSFEGQLALINSILNSLPIYYLFFQAPQVMLSNLEQLRSNFLLGAREGRKNNCKG